MTLKEEFDQNGVVVCRGLFDASWYKPYWDEFYNPDRVAGFNPVEINGPFGTQLGLLPHEHKITSTARLLLDCDFPSLYNYRFVVKDKHALGRVMLHQDICYHVGGFNKLSAFAALSSVIPENGGMWFVLGSHKYGYLGDAGELNIDAVSTHKMGCPVLGPGDVVFMNSATWHFSEANSCGVDRVLADMIFCPNDDPAVNCLTKEMREKLFIRSRVSLIRQMQIEIDYLRNQLGLDK